MSPVTYEARGRVYVVIEDRVSTELFSFTDAVRDWLLAALTAEAQRIASATKGAVGAHGTGDLASSVRAIKASAFRDVSVSAGVKMGGGRKGRHGHLFERGFSGEERVRAHSRLSVLGNRFNVQEYRRQVSYRAHGHLEGALNKRRDSIRQSVLDAIRGVASERGLAA